MKFANFLSMSFWVVMILVMCSVNGTFSFSEGFFEGRSGVKLLWVIFFPITFSLFLGELILLGRWLGPAEVVTTKAGLGY